MRTLAACLAIAIAIAAIGCGDDDEGGGGGPRPELKVSAAASLKTAFEDYGESFGPAEARFSFAGSDELAAQIRQGAKPDLYAAANTKLPEDLFDEGEVERPVEFATNELAIAVPSDSDEVESLDDLTGEDVGLVIGDRDVPVGAYAREVLEELPGKQRRGILRNVKSEEPDVLGIVAKLTQGAATAGFLYRTDVEASEGELSAIELPARLEPEVTYGIAVVEGSELAREANLFIDGLLARDGRAAMRRAGFLPPPSPDPVP